MKKFPPGRNNNNIFFRMLIEIFWSFYENQSPRFRNSTLRVQEDCWGNVFPKNNLIFELPADLEQRNFRFWPQNFLEFPQNYFLRFLKKSYRKNIFFRAQVKLQCQYSDFNKSFLTFSCNFPTGLLKKLSKCPQQHFDRNNVHITKKNFSICWSKLYSLLSRNIPQRFRAVFYVSRKLFEEKFFPQKNVFCYLHSDLEQKIFKVLADNLSRLPSEFHFTVLQ